MLDATLKVLGMVLGWGAVSMAIALVVAKAITWGRG